jgi:hypothetical protein
MKKRILSIATVLAALVLFVACEDDEEVNTSGTLSLNISNLAALSADEQYEGWIIVDGAPVSTGTFEVNGSGDLSVSSFSVDAAQLSSATDFVLSIEPVPDTDPAPSAIKILGGSFSGSSASVSVNHGAALGDAFTSVSGKYILATPTTTSTDDELSGIWFLDNSSGSAVAGLDLPVLPSGWVYEGWVVIDGSPVSTGTFTAIDAADNAAPYSGSDAQGPPFPGEDLVANAPSGLQFPLDLSGKTAVISIEPSPDNSADPFAFKPLAGDIPTNADDHLAYDLMDNVSASFPSGTVSR